MSVRTRGQRCIVRSFVAGATALAMVAQAGAQELEIRRWNHLPVDQSFGTLNLADATGEISFDPVLQIEDAEVHMRTVVLAYIRTFEFMGKTARFEVRQGWQQGTWDGLVQGTFSSIEREGFADTNLRFAVNLFGAPPASGKAYVDYRRAAQNETIIGAALALQLPTGEYQDDRLINLGSNRYAVRPQLGVMHKRGNWIYEFTGTANFYSENKSFFNGNRLEQDPYYALDSSIEYQTDTGLWVAANVEFGSGGETILNGVRSEDGKRDYGWAISFGYPLSPKVSLKASYVNLDHGAKEGTASETLSIGLLASW